MLVAEFKDTTLVDWEVVLKMRPELFLMAQAKFSHILLTLVFDLN